MIMILKRILLTCIIYSLLAYSMTANASSTPAFSSAEHVILGENVKVFFTKEDPGTLNYQFNFPNSLSLNYGEIISFGDYYLIPHLPITQGADRAEQKMRFLEAFASFTEDTQAAVEAKSILEVINTEKTLLLEGLKNGQTSEEVYQKIGSELDRRLNCVTGGGCDPDTWWIKKGRYLILLEENFDHFGENALLAYQVGHTAAMEQALIAGKTKDLKKLELAYAMNAFASHFLTDRFASGHIRTPRVELPTYVFPSFIGNVLVNFMHDEENQYGIHVHNGRGDHWIAYGDKSYFHPANTMQRQLIAEVLQLSLNEVFAVYLENSLNIPDSVSPLIPEPDEVDGAANNDISPMFFWDKSAKLLMRREDLANPFDKHWTAAWWGWSTLSDLEKIKGFPFLLQASLAQSEFSQQAMQAGLITDKKIMAFLHSKHRSSLLQMDK